MFSVRQIAAKQLFARNTYALGFGKKRKPTPNDLEKYDVVVVGAGLGNVLATHLDAVVGEKQKIYLTYDNPLTSFSSERGLYELGEYTCSNLASANLTSHLLPDRFSVKITHSLTTLVLTKSILAKTRLFSEMAELLSTIIWYLPSDRKKTIVKSKDLTKLGQILLVLSIPTKITTLGKLLSAKPTEFISTSTEDLHTSIFLLTTSTVKSLTTISWSPKLNGMLTKKLER